MADEQRTLTANFTANASGFAKGANETIQHLRELNTELEQNKRATKETNDAIKEYQKKLKELKQATKNGEEATEEQREEMQKLEDAIADCTVKLGSHKTTQQLIQSEIRSTNKQLDEQRTSAKSVSQAFSSLGDVLKGTLLSSAIQTVLRETIELLKTVATYSYEVGKSFEAGMSQVGAISQATNDELSALTAKAKELGAATRYTATEAAEALNYMAMAGWKTEEMLSGIDGVINLAASSGEELGTVADIVTDSLTAFGLSAKDSAHFADVLAAAAAYSNTNVSMMGETFTYAAAIAGSLGFSVEDTATAIGIMANSGIKASQAGTALRTIMTNLSGDVKVAGANIGEVTIATSNADGSMRDFSEILDDVRAAFEGLTEAEKASAAESLVGKYAMSGFLSLINASEGDVNALASAIENCDGAAASMAETMQNNVSGAAMIMKSALEGAGIAAFDKYKDSLKEAINIFTEATSQLTEDIERGKYDETFERLGDAMVEVAETGADLLPTLIEGFANAISFIVEFKEAILAGAVAMGTFKASVAIGNIIDGTVTAIKALKGATEKATKAQKEFNVAGAKHPYVLIASLAASAVAAIVSFASAAGDGTEKLKEMTEAAEAAKAAAEEYADTADDLREIGEEYKNVSESVSNATEKEEALKDIQRKLIEQYGDQAAAIDLVNGKYDEEALKIRGLADDYEALAAAKEREARVDVLNAQKETITIGNATPFEVWDFWDFEGNYKSGRIADIMEEAAVFAEKSLPSYRGHDGMYNLQFGGTWEQRAEDFQRLYQYMIDMDPTGQWIGDYQKTVLEQWELAAQNARILGSEMVDAAETTIIPEQTAATHILGSSSMAEHERAKAAQRQTRQEQLNSMNTEQLEALKEQYREEKQLADDQYSVLEISQDEYYKKLTELRDHYLKENTHEWYTATSELLKLSDKLGGAAEDTADRITSSMNGVKQTYQELMAAIDAELQRRDREKQDAELQAKIDSVSAQIAYANIDEYSRRSLERELAELKAEREDILYERDMTDRKSQIQAAYSAIEQSLGEVPVGYDPNAWQDMVNMAFSQIAEGYAPGANIKEQQEAAKVYNIVINANGSDPAKVIEAVKKAIATGEI